MLLAVALLMAGAWRPTSATPGEKANFRVIGYIPWYLVSPDHMPDFGGITHLNIAFINPDSTGNFAIQDAVKKLASAAHEKGISILLSIGGGNPPRYLKTLLGRKNRGDLVTRLVNLLTVYGCDGIDVDLEGDFIDGNYEGFVRLLAGECRRKGKLVTAAVATAYAGSYTNAALAQYDFINIMSYDSTGPWEPSKPGPHATMSMAVADLVYWSGTRRIAQEKLTLGLPFYGYGFGPKAPESMSFGDIVAQYPDHRDSDRLVLPGGAIVYYNGAPTIRAKTRLAMQKAGGVMVWQLLQDAPKSFSLLAGIDSIVKGQ